MRLLGLDFETTGLDTAQARIIEMGACLWEVETKRPLVTVGVFLHGPDYPSLPEDIVRITGITDEILGEFGTDAKHNLQWLESFCQKHGVDYIVAHNGENFDKPLLLAELTRHGLEAPTLRTLPWIDTRADIPFPTEPDSRRLKHMAADHGFLNPFAHRAVFDVLTMLRVLSHYDLAAVLAYQATPFVTVRAIVDYNDRQLAKDRRYSWEKIGDKTYPRCWVRRIKQDQVEKEKATCPFKVVVLDS